MALFSRRPPTRVPTLIEEIERPGLVPEVRLPVAPIHGQSRVDDPVTVAARVLHGLSFQGDGQQPGAPSTPAQRPISQVAEASSPLPPMPSTTWSQAMEQTRLTDAIDGAAMPMRSEKGGDGWATLMDTPAEGLSPQTTSVTTGSTGAETPAPPAVPDELPSNPPPESDNAPSPMETGAAPFTPAEEGSVSSGHGPAHTSPPLTPPQPVPAWMLQGRMVPPPARMVLPVRVGGRPQGGVRTDLSMGSFGNPSIPLRSPAAAGPAETVPMPVVDLGHTQAMAASAHAADTPSMPVPVIQPRLNPVSVPDTSDEISNASVAGHDQAIAVSSVSSGGVTDPVDASVAPEALLDKIENDVQPLAPSIATVPDQEVTRESVVQPEDMPPVAMVVPDPLPPAPLPPPLAALSPPVAVAPAVPSAPTSPPAASPVADVPAVGEELQRLLQQHIETWLQQQIPQLAQQWAAALAPELQRQMMVKMASMLMLQLGENPFDSGISHKKKVGQSPLT